MDNILLCSGYLPTMTLIHNIFIENYMLSANGSYVKVYLYLAKCIQAGEKDLSISTLADKMDNTEKDVLRALHYWEKHNLIHLSKDESGIIGIEMLNPEVPVTEHTDNDMSKEQKKTDISEPKLTSAHTKKVGEDKATAKPDGAEAACTEENTYTETTDKKATDKEAPSDQIGKLSHDEEFIWTCRVIESYVSRPLNPGEVQLISYLYESLCFSPDLLLYLYEYCISRGKTHVNYIQKIAISWHEENIKSPEEAKNFSSKYNSSYTAISKALGLGHQLTTAEQEFADRWLNEWQMDLSIILDACNRTVLQIQKGDLKYTQKILRNWHNNNIRTLQDVKKADEEYAKNKAEAKAETKAKKNLVGIQNNTQSKNQFHQFHQREVSKEELDELERKLLAR